MFHRVEFLVFLIGLTQGAKFPSEWGPPCKMGPNLSECVKQGGTKAIKSLLKGNPAFGIYPIEPLHFEEIYVDRGNGPVSISLRFINVDIKGVQDLVIQELDTDWKKLKVKIYVPRVTIQGKYDIKGKILVLPITGNGQCLIHLDDFLAEGSLSISKKTFKGKTYYNANDIESDFQVKFASFNLDNLFNGDKALGNQMNIFLNENWKAMVEELKPAILKALNGVIMDISGKVFSKIPADVITPA